MTQGSESWTNTIEWDVKADGFEIGTYDAAIIVEDGWGGAAFEMIKEIRRQFREIDGLLEGTAEPDTAQCVDIATSAALKKMILPGVIAVSAPPLVGFLIGAEALGGMLAGALLSCVLMALMMSNAGGAWDNARSTSRKATLAARARTHMRRPWSAILSVIPSRILPVRQ